MSNIPRRVLLRRTLELASGLAALSGIGSRTALAAESCADPSSESLRDSLHYAAAYANAAETCRACAFFTPASGDGRCGACAILSGPADATGHCDSWSAREK